MAEAVMLCEIEMLQNFVVNVVHLTAYGKEIMEEIISEMKLLVGVMREKKLEERMSSSRLNYLISDVIDKARKAYYLHQTHNLQYVYDMTNFRDALKISNKLLRGLHLEAGPKNDEGEVVGFEGDDVVGLEGDVGQLLHKITSMDLSKHQPFVASINGIAGSGKTTLARQLYDHADVVRDFEPRVWVNCTESLSQKELLVNLVRLVANGHSHSNSNDVEKMERIHLQEMLAQHLHNKKFFIVLDDIRGLNASPYFLWDILELWYSFRLLDNDGKGRSIILFTSRTRFSLFFIDYYHDMQPLDAENSWQLLLKFMSSRKIEFPKQLERKGKLMLMKHSEGLPLAIKEVTMEWEEKKRLEIEIGWEEVVESKDLKLRTTLRELDSSVYYDLDPVDKSCFLLLSLFKLGPTIRARKLQQIWDAAGVAWGARKESRYLTSLEYLIELKIIETKDITENLEPKNVCVSSIFHRLSIMKAKKGDDDGSSLRVIFCGRDRINVWTDPNEQLSCVSFHGGGCFNASPSYWKSFKKLRVLEFEGFGLTFLPEVFGELIELRYLGLRDNHLQELPSSLCYLKKLKVLDIALNFMVKVPDILWEMDALVHLYMSDICCMKPLKIEALKNLETLTYISVDNWAYEVSGLRVMTSLRKVGVAELDQNSNVSKLFASLAALEGLENLVLRGFRFRSMPSLDEVRVLHRVKFLKIDGLINKLPSPGSFPPCLYSLTLVNSRLDEDPMPVLEKLPHLGDLKLQNAYTGLEMVISEGGFPKLGWMSIGELWHLRSIQVGEGAWKWIENLEITSCPCLHSLPKTMIPYSDVKLKMVTTRKIAANIKNSGLFSHLEQVDIQP